MRGFDTLRATNRIQFVVWLRTLFVNNVRAPRRRYLAAQKRDVFSEQSLDKGLSTHKALHSQTMPAIDSIVMNERVERLFELIKSLPLPIQTVLKWRYEDELTLGEIAIRVERSEDAVRMLIKRCLARLRPEIFDDESRT